MDGRGANDFDGGNVCNIAQLLINGLDLLLGELGVAVDGGFFSRGKAEVIVFSAHNPRISHFV